MTGWPGVSTARAASSCSVLPETVGPSVNRPRSLRRAATPRTAGVLVVLGGVLAARGEVADEGRALGDLVEVFHGDGDSGTPCAMAMRCSTALVGSAGGGDGGDGVLDRRAGDDVRGLDAFARQLRITMRPAWREASCLFPRTWRGRRRSSWERCRGTRRAMAMVLAVNWLAAGLRGQGQAEGFELFELRVVNFSPPRARPCASKTERSG